VKRHLSKLDLASAIGGLLELVPNLKDLDTTHSVTWFFAREARREYASRRELVDQIGRLERLLEAAGDCPATASFPKAQLIALKDNLRRDMDDLIKGHGEKITREEEEDSSRSWGGSWGSWKSEPPKPKFADPTPDQQLPARVALTRDQVATIEGASNALLAALKSPDLAASIAKAAETAGTKKARFESLLAAYALLADEATTAPDYARGRGYSGPDRSYYRARKHASSTSRNDDSQARLLAKLDEALKSEDPTSALERTLVSEFMREISLPAEDTRDWAPKVEAIEDALAGEAFVPLRYFNDLSGFYGYSYVWSDMKKLFREVSRAVVEGRLDTLKHTLPSADDQLSMLTPEGKAAWIEPLTTETEIKDSQGTAVTLKTHEARGVERLWVTKGHTGSHGFDHSMGAPCLLAYLTNARTEAIVVDDPRWPQHAGRMYMRALRMEDGTPVLFIESLAKDNEYPCTEKAEEVAIAHAIKKAKAIGAQLVVSGYAADTVKRMGLKGEWTENTKLVLSRTPLLEASVAFGSHDWVHDRELCVAPNFKNYDSQKRKSFLYKPE
jgi:hypothetical protein